MRLAPEWLRHYERSSWRLDVIAGLTVKQIPKLLGIEVVTEEFIAALWHILKALPDACAATLG